MTFCCCLFVFNSQKEDMHDSESRMSSKQNQQISVGIMRDIINSIQLMLINVFHAEGHLFFTVFLSIQRVHFLGKSEFSCIT